MRGKSRGRVNPSTVLGKKKKSKPIRGFFHLSPSLEAPVSKKASVFTRCAENFDCAVGRRKMSQQLAGCGRRPRLGGAVEGRDLVGTREAPESLEGRSSDAV